MVVQGGGVREGGLRKLQINCERSQGSQGAGQHGGVHVSEVGSPGSIGSSAGCRGR